MADRDHIQLMPDPVPDHLIFVRSDQYSFIRRGVPAMTFEFAAENGEEQHVLNRWLIERYHGQADDLDQPVDLAAADAYDRFLMSLIGRVANDDAAPSWNDKSFFKRFASAPLK